MKIQFYFFLIICLFNLKLNADTGTPPGSFLDTNYYTPAQNEVKLFFDKYGQLYPESYFKTYGILPYDGPDFIPTTNPDEIAKLNSLTNAYGTEYSVLNRLALNIAEDFNMFNQKKIKADDFTKEEMRKLTQEIDFSLKKYFFKSNRLELLYDHYQIDSSLLNEDVHSENVNDQMWNLQSTLIIEKIKEIEKIYSDLKEENGSPPKIFFFVHGYNNDYKSVEKQKDSLRYYHPEFFGEDQNILFVTVNWYGFSLKHKDPTKVNKFGSRKNTVMTAVRFKSFIASSYMIGIELRHLINRMSNSDVIDETRPIYLLAHSLGANVISSMFTNHTQFMKTNYFKMKFYNEHLQKNYINKYNGELHQEQYQIPYRPIKSAWGAAAVPGFIFDEMDPSIANRFYNITIGFNKNDLTLRNFVFVAKWKLTGATDLGCSKSTLKKVLGNYGNVVNHTDFSKKKNRFQHDFTSYMKSHIYKEFLGRLFPLMGKPKTSLSLVIPHIR